MLALLRFKLYRWVVARTAVQGFETPEIWPLTDPEAEHIEVETLAPELPQLYATKNYPYQDRLTQRLKRIKRSERLLPIISRVPAAKTAPIATDHAGLLKEIYPEAYRKAWPQPPVVPPELEADDVFAALAVSGPFSLYLQRASAVHDITGKTLRRAAPGDYVVDMSWFEGYAPKPGLLAPGGIAVFEAPGDRLRTKGIVYKGEFTPVGSAQFERVQKLLLCALNTHLTTFFHNVTTHLAYVTPMVVAATNELRPEHPIRRLLHPACHTTLIGNYEVATFQVVGKSSFATRLFSYDYETLTRMIGDHLSKFRIADLDPEVSFERAGLADGLSIRLPHWNDALALWRIHKEYVTRYVALYYPTDKAVADDPELKRFVTSLDTLLPSGLYDKQNYLTAGTDLNRQTLVCVCATFLHHSSVTHDLLNNAPWDYATLSHAVPTVVPESLEPQDVRLSFDYLTTFIGTWKPYNMLLDGVSGLALDGNGRKIMNDYIEDLKKQQEVMDKVPRRPGRVYPNALNPSVSN